MEQALNTFIQQLRKSVADEISATTPSNSPDWSEFVRTVPENKDASRAMNALALSLALFSIRNMLDLEDPAVKDEYQKICQKVYSMVSNAEHISGVVMNSELSYSVAISF